MERVPCSTAVEALDLTMNKGYPTSVVLEIIVHGHADTNNSNGQSSRTKSRRIMTI